MLNMTIREWAEYCDENRGEGGTDDISCSYCRCKELCFLVQPGTEPWEWIREEEV